MQRGKSSRFDKVMKILILVFAVLNVIVWGRLAYVQLRGDIRPYYEMANKNIIWEYPRTGGMK